MKKIIRLLILLITFFSLVSCGNIEETPNNGGGEIDNPVVNPGNQDNNQEQQPSNKKTEFIVSLVYNKEIYKPSSSEKIQVVWADDYNKYTASINSDGYAKIEKGVTPKRVYDAKDAGMPDAGLLGRTEKGRFISKSGGLGTKAVFNEETGRFEARAGKKYEWNETVEKIRQYNVEKNNNTQETFDSYSKDFLNRGE